MQAEVRPAEEERAPARRQLLTPARGLLGLLLLAALGLRLWSIKHGLPWVYNRDEELHFVPVAVEMFGGSLNPGYFENPPALTYLLYAVFRLRFSAEGFRAAFAGDPTAAFETARVVVALIGTASVAFVHWAGRRWFDARVGLLAAALVAFGFLPAFYGKLALNDAVTLAPVAVGFALIALAWERERVWWWAAAGAAIGVATAVKYTAGAMLLALAAAIVIRSLDAAGADPDRSADAAGTDPDRSLDAAGADPDRSLDAAGADPDRSLDAAGSDRIRSLDRGARIRAAIVPTIRGGAVAGVAFAAAFLVLNPYSVVDFSEFRSQVAGQSATAGGSAKLGQTDVPGWIYYAWTLTWGLGWVPALAAVGGGIALVRDNWRRGLVLVAFPLFLFAFLGFQSRYFGRWLMPAYPAIVLLAAYGAIRAADWLGRGRRWVLPLVAVLMLAQGVASTIRSDALLARADTRELARDWILRNVPRDAKLVVEPFVPRGWMPSERLYPIKPPFQAYEKKLEPSLIDTYRAGGYCYVVVASHQKGRGLEAKLPGAIGYYERLNRESDGTRLFDPWRSGADRPGFNFDMSFNYYPTAHVRPGPFIEIHHLRGCSAA